MITKVDQWGFVVSVTFDNQETHLGLEKKEIKTVPAITAMKEKSLLKED